MHPLRNLVGTVRCTVLSSMPSIFHRIAYQFTFSMASLRDCTARSVIKVGDMNTSASSGARDPGDQARLYPDYQESARGGAQYRIMGPAPPAIEAETRVHG